MKPMHVPKVANPMLEAFCSPLTAQCQEGPPLSELIMS
jgi:hypothetical protein